ncbi:MAG: EAL domain-containing protein, partial [Erysipelotrichaceae bacterium]|nr:EAL domain-containing protein [Erysipelotrichaceae bacterium]
AQNSEQKVVRVGWYESTFHRTDQFGRKSGYGYEYQQRVAVFTGWTYEYVEGSWSELFEMLVEGKIDLLSDVSYTPERAEKILYSALGMGSEDYHAFIAPDNTEIRPDDFSTFNGKRVGVNKNSIQEQLLIEWAKNRDVHPQIIELSVKTPELLEMLAKGEIDVLVTLDTYGNSADVIPVCKIGSSDFYFGINKNRPDLKKELDTAMNRMVENNRDFNQQLTEKFNKASAVNSFLTAEEMKWVNDHDVIKVGYRDDFLPYCDFNEESNALAGALSDYLNYAKTCEKNADLNFETRPFTTSEEAIKALKNGEVDCIFPINLTAYDAEQLGMIITDPFVTTDMYVAVRTADHQGVSPDMEMTVAVLKGHPNHETFLKDYFPNWKIQYHDSSEENFKAVKSGEADCTLISNYRLNRVSDLCIKNKLSTLATGESMGLCFALNRKDDSLYSILNKIIHLYPDTAINSSLTGYSFLDEKVTFADYLRDNLIYVVLGVAIIALIITALALRSARFEANANARRQLISETERDPLTSLYNWNFFIAYVNRLYHEHPEKHMDAVVINIDRFHSINDLHGHDFGDTVLNTMGKEIQTFLDENEGIACRAGADRFDIYSLHREDWRKVLDHFQKKINELSVSASIRLRMGVKPWQEEMEPVLQFDRARIACNSIRGDHKTQIVIYDEKMDQREKREQRLLNDLRMALEQNQFQVWYQPKYNIKSDPPKLASAEALTRWVHPELGIISPVEFIPLLEGSGQITMLDHFVWEEAARNISRWRNKYGVRLPVSVNLSRIDVFDPNLINILNGIIDKYGLDYKDFKLEVTESAYTENADYLIKVIEKLREIGYEIEMDDFGSGYSSLNMLSSMPIDILKMDMAFVKNIERNEEDFHLVELILDIARYLNVPVVAEGVETENQLRLLKDAGCDFVQGFYFAGALNAGEFEEKIIKCNS